MKQLYNGDNPKMFYANGTQINKKQPWEKDIEDWKQQLRAMTNFKSEEEIEKLINQAKQEERERIKENIERINIFPIAAIDGMVLEFISKGKVLKLLTKSNKDE
jgi:DNA-binding transcriptional regulator GbsR (MarR family)